MGWDARQVRGTGAARQAPTTFAAAAASRVHHQWRLLLLVGVSAPAVPPISAPAPAPRPPPIMAPAAAPPPAPIPTFLARLRLPLLLLLFLLERLRLLEVAAITGTAVSASSPKHRATAHSDFFIDRPSPNKICNQSANLGRVFNRYWLHQIRHSPSVRAGPQRAPLCATRLYHFVPRRSHKT